MAHKRRLEYLVMMENLELPISPVISDRKQMEVSVKKALLAGYFMQVKLYLIRFLTLLFLDGIFNLLMRRYYHLQ